MDRRKKEVGNIVKNLQDECNITVELLNKLLSMCGSQSEAFQKVETKDVHLSTERFLAFTQFQNRIIQSLLQFDITLEELIDNVEKPCNTIVKLHTESSAQTPLLINLRAKCDGSTQTDHIQSATYHSTSAAEPSSDYSNPYLSLENHAERNEPSISILSTLDDVEYIPDVISQIQSVEAQPEEKTPSLIDFDNVEEMDFKSLEIPAHDQLKVNDLCMIGYIESPAHFYVQVCDHVSGELDNLSDLLQLTASDHGPFPTKEKAMKCIGTYCCIELCDYWYRVEVLDWCMDRIKWKDDVLIQLIDFGIKYSRSYKELRYLCKEGYQMPRIAHLCHLDGVYVPDTEENIERDNWPQKSIMGFREICGDIEKNYFRITYISHPDKKRNSYGIRFTRQGGKLQGCDISKVLVDQKLAVSATSEDSTVNGAFKNNFILKQLQECHGYHELKIDASTNDILDVYFKNQKFVEASSINEAVMNYDPLDEALTCKNLRPDGTCYKGNACTFRHVPLQGGFTLDRIATYHKAFVNLQLPNTGDEILLKVTHVISIERFYAHIVPNRSHTPTLSQLVKLMNKEDTQRAYKELPHPPGVSQLIIVKHWAGPQGNWCRGQVRSVQIPDNDNSNVKVEVYAVDYGDTLVADMSDLREMMEDFLSFPFYAVECRLQNVQRSKFNKDDEKKYLEEWFLGEKFKAKVTGIGGQNHLHVLLETEDGQNVSQMIIDAGFGKLNNENWLPQEGQTYLID